MTQEEVKMDTHEEFSFVFPQNRHNLNSYDDYLVGIGIEKGVLTEHRMRLGPEIRSLPDGLIKNTVDRVTERLKREGIDEKTLVSSLSNIRVEDFNCYIDALIDKHRQFDGK
jgi:hypothetical protein